VRRTNVAVLDRNKLYWMNIQSLHRQLGFFFSKIRVDFFFFKKKLIAFAASLLCKHEYMEC
jgi:hypothetical protein